VVSPLLASIKPVQIRSGHSVFDDEDAGRNRELPGEFVHVLHQSEAIGGSRHESHTRPRCAGSFEKRLEPMVVEPGSHRRERKEDARQHQCGTLPSREIEWSPEE